MTGISESCCICEPDWALPEGVSAFYTQRYEGFSQGDFRGSNMAMHVGDDPELVTRNRRQLPDAGEYVWLQQVHGTRCVTLPLAQQEERQSPQADASTTHVTGQVCVVMTADCLPILLCAQDGSEVAAVHAGWRGLLNGVIQSTLASMHTAPTDIMAWIGPAISQAHFEVGDEVAEAFADFPEARLRSAKGTRWLIDLPVAATTVLNQQGVSSVTQSGLCTYANPQTFYSHRYATHQGLASTGRMATGIVIRA